MCNPIQRRFRLCSRRERVMGIEPTYPAWKAGVLPLNYTRIYVKHSACKDLMRNAQNRNRTSDTRIFSPLLYQLSYLGRHHQILSDTYVLLHIAFVSQHWLFYKVFPKMSSTFMKNFQVFSKTFFLYFSPVFTGVSRQVYSSFSTTAAEAFSLLRAHSSILRS